MSIAFTAKHDGSGSPMPAAMIPVVHGTAFALVFNSGSYAVDFFARSLGVIISEIAVTRMGPQQPGSR